LKISKSAICMHLSGSASVSVVGCLNKRDDFFHFCPRLSQSPVYQCGWECDCGR
jgi:hypothetical protein